MHKVFVFVFGTLKAGFPLHERGLEGERFLGRYRTTAPYPMLVAGPWFAPMMLDEKGTGLRVAGELYEIDEATLDRLDALESIGVPGNLRRVVEVSPLAGGPACRALAYMKDAAIATPRHTGWLSDYRDRCFVPPEHRGDGVPNLS